MKQSNSSHCTAVNIDAVDQAQTYSFTSEREDDCTIKRKRIKSYLCVLYLEKGIHITHVSSSRDQHSKNVIICRKNLRYVKSDCTVHGCFA